MRRSPRSRDEGSLVVLLLPERARSECARSTAAVGPTRVALHERAVSELGRIFISFDTRSGGHLTAPFGGCLE